MTMAESKLPNQQQQQQAFMRGHYTFSVPDEIINSIMEALSHVFRVGFMSSTSPLILSYT